MAFVYIVRCADRSLYTGSALDLNSRLKQHNSGKASKYTRGRLPVKLIYSEQYPDLSTAFKREYAIKRLTRAEKEKLINLAGGRKTRSLSGKKGRALPHE
jgi:putative endonuclease